MLLVLGCPWGCWVILGCTAMRTSLGEGRCFLAFLVLQSKFLISWNLENVFSLSINDYLKHNKVLLEYMVNKKKLRAF